MRYVVVVAQRATRSPSTSKSKSKSVHMHTLVVGTQRNYGAQEQGAKPRQRSVGRTADARQVYAVVVRRIARVLCRCAGGARCRRRRGRRDVTAARARRQRASCRDEFVPQDLHVERVSAAGSTGLVKLRLELRF